MSSNLNERALACEEKCGCSEHFGDRARAHAHDDPETLALNSVLSVDILSQGPFTSPQIIFFDDVVQTGSHLSFSDSSFSKSILNGLKMGMYVIQVYMGGQMTYKRSRISTEDIAKSRELLRQYPLHLFTHSPVVYNLAGSVKKGSLAWCGNDEVDAMMDGTISSLNYELSILDKIGAHGTVVHPGNCIRDAMKTQEEIEDDAICAIAKTLDFLSFGENGSAKVLLENSAGEKGKVAYSLAQLIRIREKMTRPENKNRVAFCLDTAHAFGAGLYDLSTVEGVEKMFQEIDEAKNTDKGCVELIHLNDSLVPFNGKADRHALLRTGYIWSEDDTALRYLLQQAGKRRIPCVLETSPMDMHTLYELLGATGTTGTTSAPSAALTV